MASPTISVINFVPNLSDRLAQRAIRAVNRQVEEDFAPIWGTGRSLKLHASDFDPADPNTIADDPVKGDSVMYLVSESTVPGALGYHDLNGRGVPMGFVFVTDLTNDDWTTTLSHEVLELIVDPTVNVLVPGPNPRPGENGVVLHTYEVCDAVERYAYDIDGVLVSNFITPAYFSPTDEAGTRNDFLGVGVTSFGVMPGCHLAYFNLSSNSWEQYIANNNEFPENISPSAMNREREFQKEKPKRDDIKIQQALQIYQESPLAAAAEAKGDSAGLSYVTGLTRTARFTENPLGADSS